jgi:hypothetical protein
LARSMTLMLPVSLLLPLTCCCLAMGWVLAEQEQVEEGIVQIRQGLALCQAIGAELWTPDFLMWLASAYGKVG